MRILSVEIIDPDEDDALADGPLDEGGAEGLLVRVAQSLDTSMVATKVAGPVSVT